MAKTGRPLFVVDWETADSLLKIQCTGEEIAGVLGCSYDTLERACKREHKMSFADYSAQKRGAGKVSLRRRQWKAAESGSTTMLIWLGKNWLGQSDKLGDDDTEEAQTLNVNISVREPVGDVRITKPE